jgi:hypothetical protein
MSRPLASVLLLALAVGMTLSALAAVVPMVRLGYDTTDLLSHVSALESMAAENPTTLLSSSALTVAQGHVQRIEQDLNEINGVANVVGAPLGAVNASMRNYQILLRMGSHLATAADEGLSVAQTLLIPLQGGAFSAGANAPIITPNDLQHAQTLLADAQTHVLAAIQLSKQLDPAALPSQLKPGSAYGRYLALLPQAPQALATIMSLLEAAPALLGIGSPSYFLVFAMDRTELRPGGGFMGNFGLLKLDGGRLAKDLPLALGDTYAFDARYFAYYAQPSCADGPTPPAAYSWWPFTNLACTYGWGLRDSNLSPDFPTNARMAIQIAQDLPGTIPGGAPVQGVIAFTPALIANLLSITGNIAVPNYNVVVTPNNLEATIHAMQLGGQGPAGVPRKEFTHQLSMLLLDRLKSLPLSKLSTVLTVARQALMHKDLQIYFSDARAERILQQMDLGSSVNVDGHDGFFVVDTNDSGNKANLYVTEHQTDVVTLLPNGGALHRLQIAVTYDKQGSVFNPGSTFDAYSDVQRTYLPADASILGYSGFNPPVFNPGYCSDGPYYAPITQCNIDQMIQPSTASDLAGRAMVMDPLLVPCGATSSLYAFNSRKDYQMCESQPVQHTQTIYVEWYTPHAFTRGADGHGAYMMLVEKQPGTMVYRAGQEASTTTLTVYVNVAALAGTSNSVSVTPDTLVMQDGMSAQQIRARDASFRKLIATGGAQAVFDGQLLANTVISFAF